MIAALAFVALVALAPAAYVLGHRHGMREAVDDLWEPAIAIGAYGQMVRDQAAAEGLSVVELLERERQGDDL